MTGQTTKNGGGLRLAPHLSRGLPGPMSRALRLLGFRPGDVRLARAARFLARK